MTDKKAAGASPRCLRRIWDCTVTKQFPVSIIIAIPQQLIEHFRFHALYFLCERAIMIAVIWFDTLLCQASYLLQEKPKLFSTKRVFLS